MSASLDLETCRKTDQVLPYLAASQGVDVDTFIANLAAFIRLHKREAIPDAAVFGQGTYADLLASMKLHKVKNYVQHLKRGHLTVIDLYPIAFFLNATFVIHTIDASGTNTVVSRTINAGAGTKTYTLATVGGHLSLYLECRHAVVGQQSARHALLADIKKQTNAAHLKAHAAAHSAAASAGKAHVALLTADEIKELKALHHGSSALSDLDILSALIARHAAEHAGASNVLSKADLLASIHAQLTAGKEVAAN